MTALQDVPKTVHSIELRDYQQLAVQHILLRIEQACLKMYVTLPTGTGKAVILSALAAQRLTVGRVLVLIHRQDIAMQLVKTLKQTGLDAGLIMQGHRELTAPVIVTMTQSLTESTLHELLQARELPIATILIDEAHHAITGSAYHQIIQALEDTRHPLPLPVIGFTATPYRSDKTSMFSLLPTCAFARDIPDMVRDHWLAPLIWEPVRVNMDLTGLATTDQSGEVDFAEGALELAMVRETITRAIAQQVVARIGKRPTLLFAASVEHAQQFARLFCEMGVQAQAVSGTMKRAEREQVYADWRTGAIQIVCNCSLLTEGFDFPEIAALVIARPTLSPSLYVQMLGRGTRLALGKQDCLVLDVMGKQPGTSRQVVLPQILGDCQPQRASSGSRTPTTTEAKRTEASVTNVLKAVLGTETKTSFSLLDPIGQSKYRWTPYWHDPHEGFFTSLRRYEFAIIERDPAGSGLYRSRIYLMPPGMRPETLWVEPNYLPLRQQVALVHEEAKVRYHDSLGNKDAPWRGRPITPSQRKKLRFHYPRWTNQMTASWTQEEASVAITHAKLGDTLLYPPPDPQETSTVTASISHDESSLPL